MTTTTRRIKKMKEFDVKKRIFADYEFLRIAEGLLKESKKDKTVNKDEHQKLVEVYLKRVEETGIVDKEDCKTLIRRTLIFCGYGYKD